VTLTHQALVRLVPPLPRCGRVALRLWPYSPSPAPRERVASAARRVRVRRRPNFLRAWCARGALVVSPAVRKWGFELIALKPISRTAPSRRTRACACRVAHLRCARGAACSEAGEG